MIPPWTCDAKDQCCRCIHTGSLRRLPRSGLCLESLGLLKWVACYPTINPCNKTEPSTKRPKPCIVGGVKENAIYATVVLKAEGTSPSPKVTETVEPGGKGMKRPETRWLVWCWDTCLLGHLRTACGRESEMEPGSIMVRIQAVFIWHLHPIHGRCTGVDLFDWKQNSKKEKKNGKENVKCKTG